MVCKANHIIWMLALWKIFPFHESTYNSFFPKLFWDGFHLHKVKRAWLMQHSSLNWPWIKSSRYWIRNVCQRSEFPGLIPPSLPTPPDTHTLEFELKVLVPGLILLLRFQLWSQEGMWPSHPSSTSFLAWIISSSVCAYSISFLMASLCKRPAQKVQAKCTNTLVCLFSESGTEPRVLHLLRQVLYHLSHSHTAPPTHTLIPWIPHSGCQVCLSHTSSPLFCFETGSHYFFAQAGLKFAILLLQSSGS
jgi:hypothetical protein